MSIARDLCEIAADLVDGEREASHGDKRDTHRNIATLWNAYLDLCNGAPLDATDAACMMVLLKIARTKLGDYNADDFLDMVGYGAVAGECAARDRLDAGENLCQPQRE